ncbi:methyltransferase domain-containing protein [Sphaerisporangium sp. NPDC051011]|uniref:class I SAM-dependent methyltransferase n=1 Tax=Sphaerisporangium sp. NPDC051011 TaxID=3155792 RepID=UPI0033EF15EF
MPDEHNTAGTYTRAPETPDDDLHVHARAPETPDNGLQVRAPAPETRDNGRRDRPRAHEIPDEGYRDRVHWILEHLPCGRPGRPIAVLDLGCGPGDLSLLLAERGDQVTGLDTDPSAVADADGLRDRAAADVASRMTFAVADGHDLAGVPDQAFDAGVAGGLLHEAVDPVRVLTELHRTLRPGAILVLTVPYGVHRPTPAAPARTPALADPGSGTESARTSLAGPGTGTGPTRAPGPGSGRIFYHGSLRHLVEPLFEIRELTVLRRHLAGVAVRRDEARGTPGYAMSRAESAFLHRERLLHGEIADLRVRCAGLAARETELTARVAELACAREELVRVNAELRAEAVRLRRRVKLLDDRLGEYREAIARIRRSRAWRVITAYRRVRHPGRRPAADLSPAQAPLPGGTVPAAISRTAAGSPSGDGSERLPRGHA